MSNKVTKNRNRGNSTATGGAAAGTNVFKGSNNASNAAGVVGGAAYTITKAPYVVKTCDQVLQIPGKTINLNNYADRTPGFMTLSIYFANFFAASDSNKLIESMETQLLTQELTELQGAPGCTMFRTNKKEYSFCFESEEIRKQIQAAAAKFLNCKFNPNNDRALKIALKGCDLSKVDLTKKGPFGAAGPKIKKALDAMKGEPKKNNWKGVNPYYIKKGVPGDN